MGRTTFPFFLTMSFLMGSPMAAYAQVAEPASTAASVDVPAQDTTPPATGFIATPKVTAPPALVQRRGSLYGSPATPRRPAVLVPLYAGLVALQGYDTYSTLGAIKKGAVEVNPVMMGPASQPAVFVAVKSASTIGSIYAAERLWRKHRKGAAIAVIAVANGMLAIAAVHNASVLRAQR